MLAGVNGAGKSSVGGTKIRAAGMNYFNPDEAARALALIEEEFWASKSGQKLLRDRVERTFAEFVSRVPAKMLSEGGLKRHYKDPEPVKEFRTLNK